MIKTGACRGSSACQARWVYENASLHTKLCCQLLDCSLERRRIENREQGKGVAEAFQTRAIIRRKLLVRRGGFDFHRFDEIKTSVLRELREEPFFSFSGIKRRVDVGDLKLVYRKSRTPQC